MYCTNRLDLESRRCHFDSMKMNYALSLWNYWHYVYVGTQEEAVEEISKAGFGVEAWYDPDMSPELADALRKADPVSVHATGAWMKKWCEEKNISMQEVWKMELDDCAAFGCRTIVLHGSHVISNDYQLDVQLAQFIVNYGRDVGIAVALENTLEEQGLSFQWEADAIAGVDGLKICLDTGHIYWTDHSMADYLDALKHRIVHLHLQDIVLEQEKAVSEGYGPDHLQPGSGGISTEDWHLLKDALEETGFDGMGVFEVRPRHPLQLGVLAREYFDAL